MSALEVVLKQGYFLEYSPENKKSKHLFCGEHTIKGADCPNCDKLLHRFVSLDLKDEKLNIPIKGIKKLHILYCWRCNVAQDDFFYKLVGDDEIEILKYGKGTVHPAVSFYQMTETEDEEDFPYDDYPVFFPGAGVSLKKIQKRIQSVITKLNSVGQEDYSNESDEERYSRPMHQIGGEPYLVQSEYTPSKCPECRVQMPLLATIGDDCLDERGLGGNSFAQVIYGLCIKCKILSAYQQCD